MLIISEDFGVCYVTACHLEENSSALRQGKFNAINY